MSFIKKYIDLLIQMLVIPSLSGEERIRAVFLQEWLEKEGFNVKVNGNNLIAAVDPDLSKVRLLLNSHIDTVSPASGWKSDPNLPLIENGRITGLGSNDAGASVVSIIGAYKMLMEKDLAGNIALVLSAEEEISGKNGIASVLGLFPELQFAVVGEPTGMQPAVAERGLMVVDASTHGIAGHAARNEGENAIYKAMNDLEHIRELTFPKASEWLDAPSVNVTMIQAGTNHNTIPDTCNYVIDVRSNDRYSNEDILQLLRDTCDAELNPRSLRLRSSFLQEGHPAFDIMRNLKMKPFGSPTLSDMALISIPGIKIGPGDSARSHTANEYILEEEIQEAIPVYVKFISQLKDILP